MKPGIQKLGGTYVLSKNFGLFNLNNSSDVFSAPRDPVGVFASSLRLFLKGGTSISGDPVDSWGDTAGIFPNLTSISTNRPTQTTQNGIIVPFWDGINDYLASGAGAFERITGSSGMFEIWAVINPSFLSAGAASTILAPGVITEANGAHGITLDITGARFYVTVGTTTSTPYCSVPGTGSRFVLHAWYDNAFVNIQVNNGTIFSASKTGVLTSTNNSVLIGINYNLGFSFSGSIADVFAIDRTGTAAERNETLQYLQRRWNL
jgi:hypothetical protein